uniref:Uncharacterized protein n=1 Tax=Cannabis sativa TaxID=3483 RepID=A0A803NHN6_CANSA
MDILSRAFRKYVPCSPFGTPSGFLVHPDLFCGGTWCVCCDICPHHFTFALINCSINDSDDYYPPNLSSGETLSSICCTLPFRFLLWLRSPRLSPPFILFESKYQIKSQIKDTFSFIKMAAIRTVEDDDAWENGTIMKPIDLRARAMIRGKPRESLMDSLGTLPRVLPSLLSLTTLFPSPLIICTMSHYGFKSMVFPFVANLMIWLSLLLQVWKCDESITPPPCPNDLLFRGKEKPAEKPLSFQYPHPPAITITNMDLTNFPHGSQMMNPFLTQPFSFAPLLNSNVASVSCLSAPRNSHSIMIPTPINPNNSMECMSPAINCNTFNSISNIPPSASMSTDSIIVNDSPTLTNPELVTAAHSLAEALPSLVLGQNTTDLPVSTMEAPLPDPQVKGKRLACASGVKRLSFQMYQANVGGSMRSMLKWARAREIDFEVPSSVEVFEQAGDAEHTRLEK